MRQLFLDAQLSLFEELDSRKVRPGSAQFLLDLPFQTGVLELQCTEMRMFHWGSSSFQPLGSGPTIHAIEAPEWRTYRADGRAGKANAFPSEYLPEMEAIPASRRDLTKMAQGCVRAAENIDIFLRLPSFPLAILVQTSMARIVGPDPKAARTDRYRLGIRRVTAIVMKTH